jgi:hypothetical protein
VRRYKARHARNPTRERYDEARRCSHPWLMPEDFIVKKKSEKQTLQTLGQT